MGCFGGSQGWGVGLLRWIWGCKQGFCISAQGPFIFLALGSAGLRKPAAPTTGFRVPGLGQDPQHTSLYYRFRGASPTLGVWGFGFKGSTSLLSGYSHNVNATRPASERGPRLGAGEAGPKPSSPTH